MNSKIIWLTPERFNTKPDKSTWIEMADALTSNNFPTTILTSTSKNNSEKHLKYNKLITYLPAIDLPFIFRFSLLYNMFFWLKKHSSSHDIIILNHETLLLTPFLKVIGLKKIHLDFRTLPVDTHTAKDNLDKFLFWYLPLKLQGRHAQSYSFITERLRHEVEKKFNLKIKNYVIWQSGVSTSIFYPISTPKQPNTFRLFYHGTVTINRGIGLVLKALLEIKEDVNITFTIVGDGSGLEELKAMTLSSPLLSRRVIFKGLLPYEQMVTEINHSDVCICPLTNRLEWDVSSPIKVFEYLACGKPIILTPISAHKDVVEGEPYIIWTEGFEPSDFSEAIIRAIEKKSMLALEAEKATDFVKSNYQWKNQAEKLRHYLHKKYPT